jgi:catalase
MAKAPILTASAGYPVCHNQNSLTTGPREPLLLRA